jgi:MoaA/NifB/PqqE/SkfB family radical SAM enzyme
MRTMDALFKHNTEREAPTFANINMLGKCNAKCYFCLGEDIPEHLAGRSDHLVHYSEWPKLEKFLEQVKAVGIHKVYLTGQNTDALMCKHLASLIYHVQEVHCLDMGLRTNGIKALSHLQEINTCRLETGYSIHSLDRHTNRRIMCTRLPKWSEILPKTERARISIVVNRYNIGEFYDLVKFVGQFPNVQHVQARRVSTETRRDELERDLRIYEALYADVQKRFPQVSEFYGAPIHDIDGVKVTFWRTVKTKIGSLNYFTDGTISGDYFVVKGYTDAIGKPLPVVY